MASKAIISIEGGTGKSVMFTALLPELKKKYRELYIISPYYDIFRSFVDRTPQGPNDPTPSIDGAWAPGDPHLNSLYLELVTNHENDCDILWKEPYSNQNFIKKKYHLFNAWREEFGLPLKDYGDGPSTDIPTIDLRGSLYEDLCKDAQTEASKILNDGQQIILVQFQGGHSPLGGNQNLDWSTEPLHRNYFRAQQLINDLHAKYPAAIIFNYALQGEKMFEGTKVLQKPYLWYSEFAKYASAVVAIDSSLGHLVTGKCPNTTIIWGETRARHFGYACNKNIEAKNVLNSSAYFKSLGSSPAVVKFPHPDEIMAAVEMSVEDFYKAQMPANTKASKN